MLKVSMSDCLSYSILRMDRCRIAARLKSCWRSQSFPKFDPKFQTVWSTTKILVSNYLIECAVKLRMIQEFCSKHYEPNKVCELEERALSEGAIGRVVQGAFRLTIREACNKIIHATSATIDFVPSPEDSPEVLHWNGCCNLRGHLGNNSWHVELYVAQWGRAVTRYLELLAEDDNFCYLGQDYA